jgi:hypothetical protein
MFEIVEVESMLRHIKELLETKKLNQKADKWKKHFPTAEFNDDKIKDLRFDDSTNEMLIKFKKSEKEKYYFSNRTWNKNNHSFNLSAKKLYQHPEYIIKEIDNILAIFNLHKKRNIINEITFELIEIPNNYDDYCKEITNEFNKENKLNEPFDEVYALNIFPHHSFIFRHESQSIELATYYVIAYNKTHNVINIFFETGKYFRRISHNLDKQINEYNLANKFNIADILQICENISFIREGRYAVGNYIYETKLDKINEGFTSKLIYIAKNENEIMQQLFNI